MPGRWLYGASSAPRILAGLYAYHQFHTIAQAMDAGWDESSLIWMRRLLQIGNEVWWGEHYHGYPTNQVGCWSSVAVAAWGATAAERRKSRVELWRKLPQLAYTCVHPEPRNGVAAFVSTLSHAHTLLLG